MKKTIKYRKAFDIPWLTVSFSCIILLLYLFFGSAPASLLYDRYEIAQGQYWRLLSGHFVHCDVQHLSLNLMAFLILGGLLEQRLGIRMCKVIVISCLGVSGWLWFVKGDLLLYCGLSGMLNGLLTVLLVVLWQETRNLILPFIGAGALLKVVFEVESGQAILTDLSWDSVPGAHGAGLATGLLYLLAVVVLKEKGKLYKPFFIRC
jgi:rhomboid family GlyGly-CTERM serine protease